LPIQVEKLFYGQMRSVAKFYKLSYSFEKVALSLEIILKNINKELNSG